MKEATMKPGMDSFSTESERIEWTAAEWFFKRDSDAWTVADQVQLDEWLNSSTAHRVALLRLNAGWKRAARMKALGAGVPAGTIPPPGSWGDIRYPGGLTQSQVPASGSRGSVLDSNAGTATRAPSSTIGTFNSIKIAAALLTL